MKNVNISSATFLVLAIFILAFIHFINKHKECKTIVETSIDDFENIVVTENHICEEKFNF